MIELAGRAVALVDDEDYDWLISMGRWHRVARQYAANGHHEYMHRVILGLKPGDKRRADHINGDGLDNRRANLRIATQSQNMQNRTRAIVTNNKYSRHRGVTMDKRTTLRRRWIAQVLHEGQHHFLGRYETEAEAASVAAAFRREHMPFASG